jgi:RNA polymerase sigma-70 factor, ECF subfamily
MTMAQTAQRRWLTSDPTDQELVGRIARRDQLALREVMSEYGGRVLGVARRTLRDAARAEEVAQDTFLALWTRPEAYDPARGSLRSLLLGIAHHKSVDAIRKQSVRDRVTGQLEEPGLSIDVHAPGDKDHEIDLRRAICTLTPKLKEALFMAYFAGLTYREVASELGIPEGTAKTRIRDALTHLRAELSGGG